MKYRLGLKPVEAQPKFKLVDFLHKPDLPTVESLPTTFGHADLIAPQMFMNDQLGDCAIAGSIEEVRLLNACRGVTVPFTDATAIKNYSAVAGYKPGEPDTDQGTDVHDLFAYRKKTGIVDAKGKRHKVVAWAGLTPGDFDELLIALRLFEVVGIGVNLPDFAEQQFEAGQPWHTVTGRAKIEGGHYVPIVSRDSATDVGLFTWGAKTGLTAPFYAAYNSVAVVAFTEEMLTGDVTIDGFNRDKLVAALPELNTGNVAAKAPEVAV